MQIGMRLIRSMDDQGRYFIAAHFVRSSVLGKFVVFPREILYRNVDLDPRIRSSPSTPFKSHGSRYSQIPYYDSLNLFTLSLISRRGKYLGTYAHLE